MIRTENLRSAFTKDDVDEYLYKLLPERDAVVREMEDYAAEHGIPIIGPAVARLLSLLVQISGAKRISYQRFARKFSQRIYGPRAEVKNSWAQEALEKTLQFNPDVIIMDISMPVMNGLEAASLITKKQPQIPVILFSLHLSDDLYRHFKTDGIRGAVAKGDAARDLVLAVRTVLAGGTFFPGKKSDSN